MPIYRRNRIPGGSYFFIKTKTAGGWRMADCAALIRPTVLQFVCLLLVINSEVAFTESSQGLIVAGFDVPQIGRQEAASNTVLASTMINRAKHAMGQVLSFALLKINFSSKVAIGHVFFCKK